MNDLEKQVLKIIHDNPGLKGREIAGKLGLNKSIINSLLSNSRYLHFHNNRVLQS